MDPPVAIILLNRRYAHTFTFFFFNDTATTEIYTLSLHDALPISQAGCGPFSRAFSRRRASPNGRVSAWHSTPLARKYIPDRKSTRLNSSHLVISYAVFCLKKKKQHLQSLICTPVTITRPQRSTAF